MKLRSWGSIFVLLVAAVAIYLRALPDGGRGMTQPSSNDDRVAERLAPVIAAAAERIHYGETRRANYSVMAGALIAAGIAVLTFASGSLDALWMRMAASCGAGAAIITGIVVVWLYGQQTNRYPFTDATRAWKWFYRDALQDRKAFNTSPLGYLWWGLDKTRVEAAYSGQLGAFRAQASSLSDAKTNFDQDVEQLYVLHVTELYKNIFLKHLRWTFNFGLTAIVIAALFGGYVGWRRDIAAQQPRTYPVAIQPLTAQLIAKRISPLLSAEPLIVVFVKVSNGTHRPMTWDALIPRDRDGWPLPAEISYPNGKPEVIEAGKTATVFAEMKMKRESAEKMQSFSVRLK